MKKIIESTVYKKIFAGSLCAMLISSSFTSFAEEITTDSIIIMNETEDITEDNDIDIEIDNGEAVVSKEIELDGEEYDLVDDYEEEEFSEVTEIFEPDEAYWEYEADELIGGTLVDVNDSHVYIRQTPGTAFCVIDSEAMMLRRRAILDRNANWDRITELSVRQQGATTSVSSATAYNSWSYEEIDYGLRMSVGAKCLYSMKKNNGAKNTNPNAIISSLKSYLDNHPEGIVLYVYKHNGWQHAVTLTGYSGDNFYCWDPAASKSSIINVMDSILTNKTHANTTSLKDLLSYSVKVWYVTTNKNTATVTDTKAPYIENASYKEVGTNGYTVTCVTYDDGAISNVKFTAKNTSTGKTVTKTGTYDLYTRIASCRFSREELGGDGTYNTKITSTDMYNHSTTVDAGNTVVSSVIKFKKVYATNITNTSAQLNFSLDGVYEIRRYKVFGKVDNDEGDYETLKYETSTIYGNGLSVQDKWLEPGTRYRFYIEVESGTGTKYTSPIGTFSTSGTNYSSSEYPLIDGAEYRIKLANYENIYIGSSSTLSTTVYQHSPSKEEIKKAEENNAKYAKIPWFDYTEEYITRGEYTFYSLTKVGYHFGGNNFSSKDDVVEKSFIFIPHKTDNGYVFTCKAPSSELYDGKCMDIIVDYMPTLYGGHIAPVQYDGSLSQQFRLVHSGDGKYYMYSCANNERIAFNWAVHGHNAYGAAYSSWDDTMYKKSEIAFELVNNDVTSGNSIESNLYTINYNLNGGTNNSANPSDYVEDTQTIVLKNPTRNGYSFLGWYRDSEFKTKVTQIVSTDRGNITLYAKWKKIENVTPGNDPSPNPSPTPSPTPTPNPNSVKVTEKFSDIAPSKWYVNAVQYAVDNGIMSGTTATIFEPDKPCTRAMMVTILYSSMGKPAVSGTTPFADLKANWYKSPVLWAYQKKITKGQTDTTFAPDKNVARQEMAVFLRQYAEYRGYNSSATTDIWKYSDASTISGWAFSAFNWANANGIINGKGGGKLDPKGNATRAEVAAMIMSFQNKFGK